MAVVAKPSGTAIKLVVMKTIDGKSKAVSRTYNKVKPAAEDISVYTVADTLCSLQTNPLHSISRVDAKELTENV